MGNPPSRGFENGQGVGTKTAHLRVHGHDFVGDFPVSAFLETCFACQEQDGLACHLQLFSLEIAKVFRRSMMICLRKSDLFFARDEQKPSSISGKGFHQELSG